MKNTSGSTSLTTRLVRSFLVLGGLLAAPAWTQAGFVQELDFSSATQYFGWGSDGYYRAYGTLIVGSQFSSDIPLTIDAIGLWEYGPAGGPQAGDVRIYQDGTSTNLAFATTSTSDSTVSTLTGIGGYQYDAITPITLQPNTLYDIVADLGATGYAIDGVGTTVVSNDPDVTYVGPVSAVPGFGDSEYPSSDNVANDGVAGPWFGPTFEVEPAGASAPEPSSFVLLGITVAIGFCGWRITRRRPVTGIAAC